MDSWREKERERQSLMRQTKRYRGRDREVYKCKKSGGEKIQGEREREKINKQNNLLKYLRDEHK
jgi:hypothetical protein